MPTDNHTDDDRPTPEGKRCLSFSVHGPWGHFRRIEGNIVKQTYRIIPRTTTAGLVAAILGIGRDQYYDLFDPGSSLIAVQPLRELRTLNMPINTLSTANENMTSVPKRGRKLKVRLPDPTALRQQHNYEVLVDPAYRIDLWLESQERYEELREMLADGKSYYVPSLGLSEHLATVDYHGEFEITAANDDEDTIEVDSAVPEAVDSIVPSPGVRHQIERSPGYMTADDGGRTTSGFVSYAYNPDGGSLRVTDFHAHEVDGRTVSFV